MDEWDVCSEDKLNTYPALRAMCGWDMDRMDMTPEETLTFYRGLRAICARQMVWITSLDAGELYFYSGMSMCITVCVGERSLLIAYASEMNSREKVIADFRSAQAWLEGGQPEPPDAFHLVFAAREDPTQGLVVRCLRLGDWSGILLYDVLPPSTDPPPPSWVAAAEPPVSPQ